MRASFTIALLLALTACGESDDAADPADGLPADAETDGAVPDAGPEPVPIGPAEPAVGPMSGYYPIEFEFARTGIDPADVRSVTVADVATYGLEAEGTRLAVTVQGAPTPGPADVRMTLADGRILEAGPLFTYAEPLDARITVMASIGASLGQGVQRAVPSAEGTLMSPAAQLARQLGAYMPLPVPVDGLLVQYTLDDIGPPPECETPDVANFILGSLRNALPDIVDPESGGFSAALARVEPTVDVHNVASGNSKAVDVLYGPTPENVPARFLSHLVYEPFTDPLSPLDRSQLEVIEALEPDLVISVDLYGNDLINGLSNNVELDPGVGTPLEQLHVDLAAIIARLGAMDAQVFLGDLPRVSNLARERLKRAEAEAEGELERYLERVAERDADVVATNAALVALAAEYDNVHVVPLAARVEGIVDGLTIGDATVDGLRFGGLVSLDELHFTSTGYALLADLYGEVISDVMDIEVPPIDIERVLLSDPEHPDRLLAAGFDPYACLR